MTPAKVGVTPKGEATRQKVLVATLDAIKLHGRDEFTTQHVAELAGVSIGTVYRYANSRVDLMDAVWPNRPQDVPW